ncbi:MAG: 3-isopropylmalate dehydratase small subunit [Xanthomonadales bacterium]|nr:3-isopropylmalate dehydratase small subunit [Xanthomonadales bacterium]
MTDKNGLKTIQSQVFSLPFNDIDTDQIFPAEFLATTEREGLGQYCFYYWRFDPKGEPASDSPLAGFDPGLHQILVTGNNFGCGSSREHAPWALLDMGIRAVISHRFADIFYSNALKNGLLPVTLEKAAVEFLHAHPDRRVEIDIANRSVTIDGCEAQTFPLDAFSAHCLIEGIDSLDFLLEQKYLIDAFEMGLNRKSR